MTLSRMGESMGKAISQERVSLVVIVVVVSVLLLPRLGENCLNGDEAQVAILARNTLTHGIPRSWDGRNLVTREWGFDSNASGVWIFSPWLPIYATAASFALLGTSAFAARLPFVVCGLLSVGGLFLWALHNSNDRRLACIAAALLGLNVQFLLFARQCQWYALAILLVTAAAWFYSALASQRLRWTAPVGFTVSMGLLFYTDYVAYLVVTSGFFIHFLFLWFNGLSSRHLASTLVIAWSLSTYSDSVVALRLEQR